MLNSIDLELVLEYGGRIHKIYEIWDFERDSLTMDMFSGIVNVSWQSKSKLCSQKKYV